MCVHDKMNLHQVFVSCCLFLALHEVATAVIQVSGVIGADATIRCTNGFILGLNATKYFCKGDCTHLGHVIIISKGTSVQRNGRYILQDTDLGMFYVTINNLTKEDSGKYWCAVDSKLLIPNPLDEVSLTVVDDVPVIIMAVLLAVTAVCLGVTVFLLCRRRIAGRGSSRQLSTGEAGQAVHYVNGERDSVYQSLDAATMHQNQTYSNITPRR